MNAWAINRESEREHTNLYVVLRARDYNICLTESRHLFRCVRLQSPEDRSSTLPYRHKDLTTPQAAMPIIMAVLAPDTVW